MTNPAPRPAIGPGSRALSAPLVEPASPVVPVVPITPPAAEHKVKKSHKHKPPKSESADFVLSLPKPLRRALKQAAADRKTTPEELAALVLSAWLEQ